MPTFIQKPGRTEIMSLPGRSGSPPSVENMFLFITRMIPMKRREYFPEAAWLSSLSLATMSSPSSSNRSHSDQEVAAIVRNASDHFCDIMKSFKVADLNAMLAQKGKAAKGTKADKAMDVSWCYTPEEIK